MNHTEPIAHFARYKVPLAVKVEGKTRALMVEYIYTGSNENNRREFYFCLN